MRELMLLALAFRGSSRSGSDSHVSHFSAAQAIECIDDLRPEMGLLTGFSHRVEHDDAERKVRRRAGWWW